MTQPRRGLLSRRLASRVTGWLVGITLVVGGCGAHPAGADDELSVVATISIVADIAVAVGGGAVSVATIVDVGSDPHSYEPVPSDARLLSGADLVIRNGLGLEGWLDRLIQTSASHVPVVTVTDGVPRRQLIQNDPHLWMDPTLARAYASAIRDALIATDPRHAMQYEASAAAFLAELDALDTFIGEAMSRLPDERRKLVTTHDAFAYLGRRYGLEVVGTIWGITTEREPSAQEVRRLVDEVRAQRVPVVFVETTVNPSLMKAVARDAGVTVGQALYGDSVGPVGGEASSYLGMMRANARTIVKGLAGDDADPAG